LCEHKLLVQKHKFAAKPTPSKTNFSIAFGITVLIEYVVKKQGKIIFINHVVFYKHYHLK